MREIELAWAAGFFDGEGSVTHSGNEVRLQVKQNQAPDGSCPDTLLRFHAAVGGLGRIGGPYFAAPWTRGFSPRRRPVYMWYARRGEVPEVLRLLWPYLMEAKKLDAERHGFRAE